MTLTPGTRLGPYEVQVAIGAGGMGEMDKARDTCCVSASGGGSRPPAGSQKGRSVPHRARRSHAGVLSSDLMLVEHCR